MAVGVGDSKDTVPDSLYFPNSLRELDGFWEYAAESTQDQVAPAPLGDSEDSGLTTDGPGMTTEVLNELPDLAKYVAEGSWPMEPMESGGGTEGW